MDQRQAVNAANKMSEFEATEVDSEWKLVCLLCHPPGQPIHGIRKITGRVSCIKAAKKHLRTIHSIEAERMLTSVAGTQLCQPHGRGGVEDCGTAIPDNAHSQPDQAWTGAKESEHSPLTFPQATGLEDPNEQQQMQVGGSHGMDVNVPNLGSPPNMNEEFNAPPISDKGEDAAVCGSDSFNTEAALDTIDSVSSQGYADDVASTLSEGGSEHGNVENMSAEPDTGSGLLPSSDDDIGLRGGFPGGGDAVYLDSDSQGTSSDSDSDSADGPRSKGPRKNSGAWLYAKRLDPLATGHTRSVLQAAYARVELKQHGASSVVLNKAAKHDFRLLAEFKGKHKVSEILLPKSMHMVKQVLGTEDASKYEFGWCGNCAMRFEADPDKSTKTKEQLLKETCPRCGSCTYQVCPSVHGAVLPGTVVPSWSGWS